MISHDKRGGARENWDVLGDLADFCARERSVVAGDVGRKNVGE